MYNRKWVSERAYSNSSLVSGLSMTLDMNTGAHHITSLTEFANLPSGTAFAHRS